MSYYRAALATAKTGNLTEATRLVQLSITLGEEAPSATQLWGLLQLSSNPFERAGDLESLRELVEGGQYRKALKMRFSKTSKAHTIRGLLYALRGRRRAARKEFTIALTLDRGNEVAWRAFRACPKTKWWD